VTARLGVDSLIFTFRSIKGRKHGDPKAANKLGDILVALDGVSDSSGMTYRRVEMG